MIRWAGMEILEQFAEVVESKHTGLLLWNVSAAAIARCYNGAAMLTNTKALLAKARESGVRVMYSKPGPVDWKSVGAPMIRMRMKQMHLSDPNALAIPTAGAATFAQGLEPQSDVVPSA